MSQIRSSYTDSINFYGGHSPLDLAQQFGTPLYVYNETVLRQRCRELKALSSLPGFSVPPAVKMAGPRQGRFHGRPGHAARGGRARPH